jgi:hypothetical protein
MLPLLLFIFVFVQNTFYIQIAHVTRSLYVPWNVIYLVNVAGLALHTIVSGFFG